jgi:hypothetical protein
LCGIVLAAEEAVAYEKPRFSRGAVDRAGHVLLDPESPEPDVEGALEVLANWRSSHAFPLNTITMDLRQKSRRVGSGALVVQRLKRSRSIIAKLAKESTMRLSQMQDIGGCRAVVDSIAQVYEFQRLYRTSRSLHSFVADSDYIASPKPSGYRSLHLIYRFRSRSRPEFDKLMFEVQLRTRIQHSWATAVETVGAVIGQALKSSEGEKLWLSFFRNAGAALAISEGGAAVPGPVMTRTKLASTLQAQRDALDVRKKLGAYRLALKYTAKTDLKKAGYFLLVLRPDTPELQIFAFSKRNVEGAYREYERFEKLLPLFPKGPQLSLFPDLNDFTGAQAVLVGADSLRSIRESYPNYYLDTEAFLEGIDGYIRRYRRRSS